MRRVKVPLVHARWTGSGVRFRYSLRALQSQLVAPASTPKVLPFCAQTLNGNVRTVPRSLRSSCRVPHASAGATPVPLAFFPRRS
jgi:hypothetical protein